MLVRIQANLPRRADETKSVSLERMRDVAMMFQGSRGPGRKRTLPALVPMRYRVLTLRSTKHAPGNSVPTSTIKCLFRYSLLLQRQVGSVHMVCSRNLQAALCPSPPGMEHARRDIG